MSHDHRSLETTDLALPFQIWPEIFIHSTDFMKLTWRSQFQITLEMLGIYNI